MLYGENIICLYHESDMDSFVGAWSVWKTFPNAGFHTRIESLLPSQILGKDLIVVGGFVPLGNLAALAYQCNSMTVFANETSFQQQLQALKHPLPDNIRILFDESRSLAGHCWDEFSGQPYQRPLIIEHVEDKALWNYHYPETRNVTTALSGYPFSFEVWEQLIFASDIHELAHEGEIVLKRLTRDIETAIRYSKRRINIGGYNIPVANVTPTMAPEACVQLAKGEPFAACYWDTPDGRSFDLVSMGEGIDVSELVCAFGGYGNRHEAKFQVPRNHPLAGV